MNFTKKEIAIGLSILIAGYLVIVALLYTVMVVNKTVVAYNVAQICNEARQEISSESEEACAKAQDDNNVEYMCSIDFSDNSKRCWTESKG